jgi:hypothetical protein
MNTKNMLGIHHGVPEKLYRADSRLNVSGLGDLKKSPKHFKYRKDNYSETPSQKFGKMAHTFILEPGEILKRYEAKSEEFQGQSKAAKEAREKWQAAHPGAELVDEDDYAAAQEIAFNLSQNALVSDWISFGKSEVSAFTDERKGRLDLLFLDSIIDLKTTSDLFDFERSFSNYGYHRQAAWYLDIVNKFQQCNKFYIIALETKAPFSHLVFEVDESAIEAGRKENEALVRIYNECVLNNEWPGPEGIVQRLGLPSWYKG